MALALFIGAGAVASHAQEAPRPAAPSEDAALAEALFREGRTLLEGGQVDAACSKLEGSQKLDPKISTLMNLAACHELQGRTASAWAEFLEAARLTRVTPVRDPKALEAVARARAEAIAPRIHRIAIEKPDAIAQGVELLVDGRALPRAAWNTPIPVDPGEREVVARAPGHAPWSRKLSISGEVRQHALAVPALIVLPEADPTVVGQPPPPPEPRSARLGSVPFLVGAGVALVGAGIGSFLGLQAIERKKERDRECDPTGCSDRGLDKQDSANTAALGSTIAFAVGGAGALFAIYWLVRPMPSTAKASNARVSGMCFGDGCSAFVRGTF